MKSPTLANCGLGILLTILLVAEPLQYANAQPAQVPCGWSIVDNQQPFSCAGGSGVVHIPSPARCGATTFGGICSDCASVSGYPCGQTVPVHGA